MRRVFIADAHLVNPEDYNYGLLLDFLSDLKGNTKTLYILGDLFEFWIGFDQFCFPHYRPVLKQLEKLASSGTEIVYFEGNHDFHLGSYFTTTLGATVYPSPATLTIDGKLIHICHGDQINTKDFGSRIMRLFLHSRFSRLMIPIFPSRLAFLAARYLAGHSKRKHGKRNARWNYKALLDSYADTRFREGCDAVVTAHFHLPFISRRENGREKTLLSVGDWISQFSYGELNGGSLSLHRFR
jgi:UDP-2,3-diacylglucosamine hydrolase